MVCSLPDYGQARILRSMSDDVRLEVRIFAGQCPWAVSGNGGQKLRARVAVRAVYTLRATSVFNFADATVQLVRPWCSVLGDVFNCDYVTINPVLRVQAANSNTMPHRRTRMPTDAFGTPQWEFVRVVIIASLKRAVESHRRPAVLLA